MKPPFTVKNDTRNHQACENPVSRTMLITDLNLAEGRNSITGSRPSEMSFSSPKPKGFTE